MNLVKVTYNKQVDMCEEVRMAENISPDKALIMLKSASYPAYIYEPAHVNTDAYFLTEIKNRACIREYSKCSN